MLNHTEIQIGINYLYNCTKPSNISKVVYHIVTWKVTFNNPQVAFLFKSNGYSAFNQILNVWRIFALSNFTLHGLKSKRRLHRRALTATFSLSDPTVLFPTVWSWVTCNYKTFMISSNISEVPVPYFKKVPNTNLDRDTFY